MLKLPKRFNPDFGIPGRKPSGPLLLDISHPAVRNPYGAVILGQGADLHTGRALSYTTASIDTRRGMWGNGATASVNRASPNTIDLDSYNSLAFFHVDMHVITAGNFNNMVTITLGGSNIILRTNTSATNSVRISNVGGGTKTYNGSNTMAAGDHVTFTGVTSVNHDFYCVVRNWTQRTSEVISSASRPTSYFSGSNEFYIDVEASDAYVTFAYVGLDYIPVDQAKALSRNPYQILKPAVDQYYFVSTAAPPAGGNPIKSSLSLLGVGM